MKNKRRLLVRILAIAAVIGIAAVMFVIGRGHTVYFDNKAMTAADGTIVTRKYMIAAAAITFVATPLVYLLQR